MRELILDHAVVLSAVAAYVFLAAVINLPQDRFEFYPWLRGTLRSLANHVPARYQADPSEAAGK